MNIHVQGSDQFSSGKPSQEPVAKSNRRSFLFGGTQRKRECRTARKPEPDPQPAIVEERPRASRPVLSADDVIAMVAEPTVTDGPSTIALQAWDDTEFEEGKEIVQGSGSAATVSDGEARDVETPSSSKGDSLDNEPKGAAEFAETSTAGDQADAGGVEEPELPASVKTKKAHKAKLKFGAKHEKKIKEPKTVAIKEVDMPSVPEADDNMPVDTEVFDVPVFLELTIGIAIAAFALGWVLTNQIVAGLLGV